MEAQMTKKILLILSFILYIAPTLAMEIQKIGAHIPLYNLMILAAKQELENNSDALCQACREGDCANVKLLIDAGAQINIQEDAFHKTPLHYAAESGYDDILNLLLKAHADVDKQSISGMTPLHCASLRGKTRCVELLLTHGACVNTHDIVDEQTPLHSAAQQGHTDVVKILLAHGADVQATDKSFWTPIYKASQNGHAEVVQMLIDAGAQVNIPISDIMLQLAKRELENNPHALHAACSDDNYNKIKLLIKAGADVNAQEDGHTPLHCAVRPGNENIIELLINSHADVNARDNEGSTALHLAALHGHVTIAQLLIEAGADVLAQDSYGWNPLHAVVAIESNYNDDHNRKLNIAIHLLSKIKLPHPKTFSSSYLNERNKQKVWSLKRLTLLNVMNNVPRYEINELLQNPEFIDTLDQQYKEIIPFLPLDDENTLTILRVFKDKINYLIHYCAENSLSHIKKGLLEKNYNGMTPLDMARKNDRQEIVDMFTRIQSAESVSQLPQELKEAMIIQVEKQLGL